MAGALGVAPLDRRVGKAGVDEEDMARLLFVVARDNYLLYDYLKQQLAGEEGIQVIMDRRKQRVQVHDSEAHQDQRLDQRQKDLLSYGFVVIRQPSEE